MKTFLSTRWTNLINITYAVDPSVLTRFLPNGLELDLIGGKAFVSVVAFQFSDTVIKGLKIPFHINFPEINLRFYVHHKGKRGIVFIKEFVSKLFVGAIANLTYNEHFSIVPVKSEFKGTKEDVSASYKMKVKNEWYEISATAENRSYLPEADSPEYYFEEQHFGYGSDRRGNTFGFLVKHPEWEVYPLKDYRINFDFGKIYGSEWEFLNNTAPYNAMLVKGSEVVLYDKEDLAGE